MSNDQMDLISLGDITPSKSAVAKLAKQIATSVANGEINAVSAAIHLNAIKQMCEEALQAIRDSVVSELELNSGSTTKWGCKVEKAEVGTKYDYSANEQWKELKATEESAKADREAFEKLLKAIPTGKSTFDEDGTELIAPIKTSTTSFKTTLAK